jgi:hypothetical protein
MRVALLLLVAPMVLASLAHADPDDLSGGVFIAHAPPGVVYTSNVTTWCDSTYLAECEDQVNTVAANTEAVWFVLSAWSEEKSLCARPSLGKGNSKMPGRGGQRSCIELETFQGDPVR